MRKTTAIIFLLFCLKHGYSQQLKKVIDTGVWAGVGLDYKFKKNFVLSLSQDIRLFEGFSEINKLNTDLGLQYTINKNFKLGANIRYAYNLRNSGFYSNDLRLNYDFMFRIKLAKKLKLRYRLRFQHVYENLVTLKRYRYGGVTSNIRNRLQVDYTIKKHQIYLSFELFREYETYRKPYFNKFRMALGSKWENKLGKLNYAIAYERALGEAKPLNYIFAKTYFTFNFKKRKKKNKKNEK